MLQIVLRTCIAAEGAEGIGTFSFNRASLMGRLVRGIVATGLGDSEDMAGGWYVQLVN